MSRDELSSMLLKLIGFAVGVHAIVGLAQPVIYFGYSYFKFGESQMGWQIFAIFGAAVLQVIGGLLIIAKSSRILEWLFAFGQGTSEA